MEQKYIYIIYVKLSVKNWKQSNQVLMGKNLRKIANQIYIEIGTPI